MNKINSIKLINLIHNEIYGYKKKKFDSQFVTYTIIKGK